MKIVFAIILIIILIIISAQIYFILTESSQLKSKLDNLNARVMALEKENAELKSDMEYFSHPENLEKELRSRFNYKKPDEKMIIVVP